MPAQMLDASRDAPFIMFEDEALFQEFQRGQSNVAGFLEYFGRRDSGELIYRNITKPFLGLIFGTNTHDRDNIIKWIMDSHMRDSSAQALILYCSDNELSCASDHFTPSILNMNLPKVLISPNKPLRISKMYHDDQYSVNPICFSEEDVSLNDVLDLLTQTPNGPGSVKFHNKINLIISQLSEPLDLQRLTQLIDEESWDDEESTFIALRQTLLTKMVALAEDHSELPLASHRQILVDLRDAILHTTRIDLVLMNMLLREFLAVQSGRKLIVVLHGERVFTTISGLSKSLDFVAQSGLASVLVTTTDPSILSSPTYNECDFLFHTRSNSSLWKKVLKEHFPQMNELASAYRPGAITMLSPLSIHFTRQVNGECTIHYWEHECSSVLIEKVTTAHPVSENLVYESNTHNPMVDTEAHSGTAEDDRNAALLSPPLSNDQATIEEEWSMLGHGDTGNEVELTEVFMTNIYRTEGVYNMRIMEHRDIELDGILSQDACLQKQLPLQETDFEAIMSHFPSRHRLLISAIIALAEPDMTALVNYEDVKRKFGHQRVIRSLGWHDFATWVKVACIDNCVELLAGPGDCLQLRLTFPDLVDTPLDQDNLNPDTATFMIGQVEESPLNESSPKVEDISIALDMETTGGMTIEPTIPIFNSRSSSYITPDISQGESASKNSLQSTVFEMDPQLYPSKFRPLVKAILQLSDNRANIQVGFEAVRKLIGKKEDIQALKLGWVTFTQMVNQAWKENYIKQGKNGEDKWIELLMPPSVAPTTPTDAGPAPGDQGFTNGDSDMVRIEADLYPTRFRPLIKAILQLSDNYTGVEVDFEKVRGNVGTQNHIKSLGFGWRTFNQMITEAIHQKYVEQGSNDGSGKWLKALLPRAVSNTAGMKKESQPSSTESPNDRLSIGTSPRVVPTPIQQGESGDTLRSDPSHPTTAENENSQKELEGIQNPPMDIQSEQLNASDYPSELYPLVFSIFSLTTKRSRTMAHYDEVWRVFQAFDGFTDTSHDSLANLIDVGIARGTLITGTDEHGLWMALKNPHQHEPISHAVDSKADFNLVEERNKSSFASGQGATLDYDPFAPLIATLAALKKDRFVSTPFAEAVVNCILRDVPDLLERGGYLTPTGYINDAEARGFIRTFGEGNRRRIALKEKYEGVDAKELIARLSLDGSFPGKYLI